MWYSTPVQVTLIIMCIYQAPMPSGFTRKSSLCSQRFRGYEADTNSVHVTFDFLLWSWPWSMGPETSLCTSYWFSESSQRFRRYGAEKFWSCDIWPSTMTSACRLIEVSCVWNILRIRLDLDVNSVHVTFDFWLWPWSRLSKTFALYIDMSVKYPFGTRMLHDINLNIVDGHMDGKTDEWMWKQDTNKSCKVIKSFLFLCLIWFFTSHQRPFS